MRKPQTRLDLGACPPPPFNSDSNRCSQTAWPPFPTRRGTRRTRNETLRPENPAGGKKRKAQHCWTPALLRNSSQLLRTSAVAQQLQLLRNSSQLLRNSTVAATALLRRNSREPTFRRCCATVGSPWKSLRSAVAQQLGEFLRWTSRNPGRARSPLPGHQGVKRLPPVRARGLAEAQIFFSACGRKKKRRSPYLSVLN